MLKIPITNIKYIHYQFLFLLFYSFIHNIKLYNIIFNNIVTDYIEQFYNKRLI